MQLLAEAFGRLLYKEFFTEKGIAPHAPDLAFLIDLMSALKKKSFMDSEKYTVEFADATKTLTEDMNIVIKTWSFVNENFIFWINFFHMMSIANGLLRADREGRRELHLEVVQRALYLFMAFDSTNYLQ